MKAAKTKNTYGTYIWNIHCVYVQAKDDTFILLSQEMRHRNFSFAREPKAIGAVDKKG